MNKTPIEWTEWTWNPLTGCKNECSYCYARKIATRFAGLKAFPLGFEPTFHPERLSKPSKLKKPSKIFCSSMGELFGPWVSPIIVDRIMAVISSNPQHIFQLLTKFPENVTCQRFHKYRIMPDNVWFGITITGEDYIEDQRLIMELRYVEAKVKFISFEPLLDSIADDVADAIYMNEVNWIIIGSQTQPLKLPEREWVDDIIWHADHPIETKIPLFIKNNLKPLLGEKLRQEFPLNSSENLTLLSRKGETN